MLLILSCRTALLEAGFTPDDYFYDVETGGAFGEDGQPPTAHSSLLMQVGYSLCFIVSINANYCKNLF